MDCPPTCTKPMTGTKVTRNQNQPVTKKGWRRRSDQMSTENPANPAAASTPAGSPYF